MFRLKGLSILVTLLLLPAMTWCWSGETWGSMSRADIENRAKSMMDPYWNTTGFTNYISPGSGNHYFAAGQYHGIAYTQNNPQENWAEFASKINTNNNGNDCSGFVSICWKMPSRYTTSTFESGTGGTYIQSLGGIGTCGSASLIRGDACNDGGSHIILFDAYSGTGGLTSMEQTTYVARRGRYWSWSGLNTYRPIRRKNLVADPPTLPTYTNDAPVCSSNWTVGTSAADKYGADYRFRSTAAISDVATWTINVGTAGSYKCCAWWSAGTNRTANVAYTLPDSSTVYVNQQVNGGTFRTLATKSLGVGNNTMKLSCWATSGFVAIADAVRFTP